MRVHALSSKRRLATPRECAFTLETAAESREYDVHMLLIQVPLEYSHSKLHMRLPLKWKELMLQFSTALLSQERV